MTPQDAQAWSTLLSAVSFPVALLIIFLRVYSDFAPLIRAQVTARLAIMTAALNNHVPLIVALTPPTGVQIVIPPATDLKK